MTISRSFLVPPALIMLSLCTGNHARAQNNGVCVVNSQTITFTCYGGCGKNGCTCQSTTSVTEPSGGYGVGVLWSTATTQCCSASISYLGTPDGECRVDQAARQITAVGDSRLVYARACDGRFQLYAVGE